jgi:uncharacterized protein YjbJ (UPF0337 family)
MSSTSDKVKGTANQVAGKVKRGVGEATDDPALKGEGKAQEAKDDLQKTVGKAKDAGAIAAALRDGGWMVPGHAVKRPRSASGWASEGWSRLAGRHNALPCQGLDHLD